MQNMYIEMLDNGMNIESEDMLNRLKLSLDKLGYQVDTLSL
jgi:hypothetical protein